MAKEREWKDKPKYSKSKLKVRKEEELKWSMKNILKNRKITKWTGKF